MVERIRASLGSLAPQSVSVQDDSAAHAGHAGARDGGHYTLAVTSQLFAGKPRVARHRMVYEALGPLMQQGIHALALSTLTPAEAQTSTTPDSIKKETQ
jgi:BolA protein